MYDRTRHRESGNGSARRLADFAWQGDFVYCGGAGSLLNDTWGTFSTCQIPEENRHVGNVPHFFNGLTRILESLALRRKTAHAKT